MITLKLVKYTDNGGVTFEEIAKLPDIEGNNPAWAEALVSNINEGLSDTPYFVELDHIDRDKSLDDLPEDITK